MAESDALTPKQTRALAALVTCPTIGAAAREAGIGERTLGRWLQEPGFRAALLAAEGQAIDGAVRGLVADLAANHETLRTIRDDKDLPAAVRLRAAMALDASLLRWRELRNIEARLAALEAVMLAGGAYAQLD